MNIDQMTDDELIKLASTDFESVLKSRGYRFGWYKPTEYVGYIYIMVNPMWKEKDTNKEMVKIGYADNLTKRVRDFSGTGYPYPSHCYAAYKVQTRLEDKDVHKLIDGLDPDLRHDAGKEYYVMDKERAYSILESIAKVSGTIDCLELNPLNDEYFESDDIEGADDSTNGIKNKFSFGLVGIPVGATLTWFKDSSITCVVKDSENTVTYNGVDYKANDLTRKLTGKKNQYSAYRRWNYNGVRIETMFNEKKGLNDAHTDTHGYHGGYAKLIGEKITWKDNPDIECEVVDSHRVKYNGVIMSFIKATRSICKSAKPRDSWMYDGKSISEICT